MPTWSELRVLILGQTYPSYSKKHGETACTGGIREDTLEMVRLYPVPDRYLQPGHEFKPFRFIRVRARKDESDPRPESLRILPESITPEEEIVERDRRRYVERCKHVFGSLEELRARQAADDTSLGVVSPKAVTKCWVARPERGAREEWTEREREVLAQGRLFGGALKPIAFPEGQFFVQWSCDHPDCVGHEMKLLQWGIHEFYRRLTAEGDPDRDQKTVKAMERRLINPGRDVFFFLGSFRTHLHNFGLMDSLTPPHDGQLVLT